MLITYQMRQEIKGFLNDEFHEYRLKYETNLDDLKRIESDMRQYFTKARMTSPIVPHLQPNRRAYHQCRKCFKPSPNAAHELRTPIARMSLMLERDLNRPLTLDEARESLDEAYEEGRRIQRLIEDLMLLARLDSSEIEDEQVSFDIGDLLLDLEELWSTECKE